MCRPGSRLACCVLTHITVHDKCFFILIITARSVDSCQAVDFIENSGMSILHKEEHFSGSESVKDVVLGMADGLTVPFALAAGITGAINAAHIVVTAGLAEIAAGSIAMGLGGYLAAKSEADHYRSELAREENEIIEKPDVECQEVADIFKQYGLEPEEYEGVVKGLQKRPIAWRDFMMRYELGLEEPDPRRAMRSAVTIAFSYIIGGMIPLTPYIVLKDISMALGVSVTVTVIALAVFGYAKGKFTGMSPSKSALQTTFVGGLAAAVAYSLARWIS